MSDSAAKPRPQFRNISIPQILSYRLPLAGKLSILHRISGALLFFCLPLVIIPLFGASVTSAETYAQVAQYAGNPLVKLVFLVLIWGYLHHFCAGIRYLALDLHIGIDKQSSKKTAGVVFGVSLALTLVIALKLFGVL
ncbi:succinate dehydrogenase, cytochrome b556 subunit [Bordetella genomosp. 5]|mgnify:CR=1 FL=1|uniref:Succinate dehydrogenase cytochrome b556 subunit n=1 Tax=Bordetella genomosp. 5 TaxID=1395608 RepID=A0A261TY37_9BORD|nr:succinate dehydrogenase, cytochrome b556 subunit [Bordetella genomosp. 5]OZI45463.1 succinate dehydrogenase, cytochrome b556 subunit [Bordetella genomosp. 5]OZI54604.1 succinate dehydrogenase, cytochrome b556 subunit [Bordetella genomosp. 5]